MTCSSRGPTARKMPLRRPPPQPLCPPPPHRHQAAPGGIFAVGSGMCSRPRIATGTVNRIGCAWGRLPFPCWPALRLAERRTPATAAPGVTFARPAAPWASGTATATASWTSRAAPPAASSAPSSARGSAPPPGPPAPAAHRRPRSWRWASTRRWGSTWIWGCRSWRPRCRTPRCRRSVRGEGRGRRRRTGRRAMIMIRRRWGSSAYTGGAWRGTRGGCPARVFCGSGTCISAAAGPSRHASATRSSSPPQPARAQATTRSTSAPSTCPGSPACSPSPSSSGGLACTSIGGGCAATSGRPRHRPARRSLGGWCLLWRRRQHRR
mmetsp:Transcript_6374/g.15252  ORF Transcript_6374/g.15252 Transcript_6374/m.15252 type:complete len:323 (+) Transcript_6374:1496-2464(+)